MVTDCYILGDVLQNNQIHFLTPYPISLFVMTITITLKLAVLQFVQQFGYLNCYFEENLCPLKSYCIAQASCISYPCSWSPRACLPAQKDINYSKPHWIYCLASPISSTKNSKWHSMDCASVLSTDRHANLKGRGTKLTTPLHNAL